MRHGGVANPRDTCGYRWGFRLNLAVEGAANPEALQRLLSDVRKAAGPEKVKPLESALSG